MQQAWLEEAHDTVLPALMRKHGVDMWVVPMREYNEDPVFSSIVVADDVRRAAADDLRVLRSVRAPRTAPRATSCSSGIALGGTSQGGVFKAIRSTKPAAGPAGGQQAQAELWGDEQWQVLKQVIEERNPQLDRHRHRRRVFAFNDGLSSGELEGMREALGTRGRRSSSTPNDSPLELIASRLPDEEAFYREDAAASCGGSSTDDVLERRDHAGHDADERPRVVVAPAVNDLGLGTWFQPSRRSAAQRRDRRAARRRIRSSRRATCCTATSASPRLRLNTDTQHMGYVLRDGETDAPAGLASALAQREHASGHRRWRRSSPGRTGNEILDALAREDEGEGHRRDDLLASDRHARPRRRTAHRPVGLPGRRARTRRREGHPEHVVLDRAAGDDAACPSGATSRCGWRRKRTSSSAPTGA